jgi:hypothetical protein
LNPPGRPARGWLVGLLVFTLVFTAVLLFAKYRYDGLRDSLRAQAQAQLDRYFASESISIEGLRGVRIRDFGLDYTAAGGARVELQAPVALVLVDLLDLLSGRITVDRVELNGAQVRLSKAPKPGVAIDPARATGGLLKPQAFRALGRDCSVEVADYVPGKVYRFASVDFDLYRLADSPDFAGRISGEIEAPAKTAFQATGRFASPEDFDLDAALSSLDVAAVNALLPAPQTHVTSGSASPVLHAEARPGAPLVASVTASFADLAVANQPAELGPLTGTLDARVRYDRAAGKLSIDRFQADTPQLMASGQGTVVLAEEGKSLDLSIEAKRLPTDLIAPYLEKSPLAEYGKADIALNEPYRVQVGVTGTVEAPVIQAYVTAAGGTIDFTPANKKWPKGNLELGLIEATWDSTNKLPQGNINVIGGTVEHAGTGLKAENVTARIVFAGKKLTVNPLQAEVTGNTCAARLEYDLETQTGEANLTGTLSGIEDTALSTAVENAVLSGTATVRAKAVKDGKKYTVEADLDATRTDVAYRWYFRKAPGVGGVARFNIDWRPRDRMNIDGNLVVASTPVEAALRFVYKGKKYRLQSIQAKSDRVDIPGLGSCIQIPYRISGGTATDAIYRWTREDYERRTWKATTTLKADELLVQAEGRDALMHLKEVDSRIELDKHANPPYARLVLHAKEAHMPPIRTEWFVPIKPDPEKWPDYKPDFRHWNYRLDADYIETAPWKGTRFSGEGYSTPDEVGFRTYAADVEGGGRIRGTFAKNRTDNAYTSTTTWSDVPAHYFLEHLKMSPYLSGASSGEVTYYMDKDDPNTLKGSGRFEVKDGKFSEEFLYSKLQGSGQGGGEPVVLPPSLRFTSLKSNIEFQRDIVRTPNLDLQSEGIHVTGSGQFITDGDMDYDIKVSISPEAATTIPMLTQYFNVEGHRLSQQNIELAFKVTGPTGGPRGQLAGSPPARVTLVSGALEMTSEALKVIDTPRKILVDLLKLGGGLVSATK